MNQQMYTICNRKGPPIYYSALSIKFAGCLTEFRLSRVGYYLKYYLAIHFQLESGSLGSTDKNVFV